MLAIRSYVSDDADATIDIFLRAIREVASKDYSSDQVAAWAQVEDHDAWAKRRASRPTWVATFDNIPVGFSALEPSGHLDMMYVHPLFQGRGVASLLLFAVEQAAGDRAISLITTHASLTARPFFVSRGFDVVAAQEIWRRGQALRNFRMAKRLAPAR